MKLLQTSMFKVFAVLAVFAVTLTGCQKEEEVFPLPTVSSSGTLAGIIGATVQVKATINAPAGIKSITVLKNGAAFDSKVLAGEKTYEYIKDYVVDGTAGTNVNFTIQVTDNKNQVSSLVAIPVAVSAIPPKTIVDIEGVIEGNVTWTANKIYRLKGFVRVGEELVAGTVTKVGNLTIEAGTTIIGDIATKGTLVIHRGSKLNAVGTAAAPIVFTSGQAVGARNPGDWGGVVLCGKAINNQGANIELEGAYKGFHGGTTNDDNSGTLKYVRIEYAGVPIIPNAEINSLTMGSVGSGTTLEYVQASYGLDDSFEWFGGTVNAKYLIAYKGTDDDFDADFGWSGTVQFALGYRDGNLADGSGSNGFEVDNDANGSANTPFTSPTFANVSIVGPRGSNTSYVDLNFQNGAQLRRNNKIKIYNTFITGYPTGLYIDSQKGSAKANALAGDLVTKNVVIAGTASHGTGGFGGGNTNIYGLGVAVSDVEQLAKSSTSVSILIGTDSPTTWFKAIDGNKVLTTTANTGISSSLWAVSGRPTFTLTAGGSESLIGTALPTLTGTTATDY
ncbi:MAG: polymer-forming cytoskeletal protein, partial [Cytophagales bacterium]|nr:polymer-forming cytoskeletal protein [Cytophagales bacterium]